MTRLIGLGHENAKVARGPGVHTLVLTLVGAIRLIYARTSFFDPLMLSASALGNSGLYTGPRPRLGGWETQLIMLPLSVLGSFGVVVWMDLADVIFKLRKPNWFTRKVVTWTASVYLIGFGLIFA